MARRTRIVTIEAEGRDLGKAFKLTEMPASQAEEWATRAFLAMGRNNVEIPPDFEAMGFAGLAEVGIRKLLGMRPEDAKPLMQEMMQCVEYVYNHQTAQSRPLSEFTRIAGASEEDIEEVSTRIFLRKEVLELHMGFSIAERFQSLMRAFSATQAPLPSTTPIAPEPSAP